MEKLVENQAYTYGKDALVYTGSNTEGTRGIFLQYLKFKEEEIIVGVSIPLERIALEGNNLTVTEGDNPVSFVNHHKTDWEGNLNSHFIEKLNQYNKATI